MIVLGQQPPMAVFEYRSCNPFSDGATSPTDDLSPIKCLAKLHIELNWVYRLSIKRWELNGNCVLMGVARGCLGCLPTGKLRHRHISLPQCNEEELPRDRNDYAVQRMLKKGGDLPYKPFHHGPGRPHPRSLVRHAAVWLYSPSK